MLEALSRGAFERDLAKLDKRVVKRRDWTVLSVEFPVFDVVLNHATRAPLRLRFTCNGWPNQPPSIEILTPEGKQIPSNRPAGHPYEYVFAGGAGIYNSGPGEQAFGGPFICMRGSREYHTHSGHRGDSWENYKSQSGNTLLGLMDQLWQVWKRAAG